jgi:signal transduction histidine kinase
MRRPWQIWLVYSLCLAVALPAMAWLTHQTLEADRAEYHARLAAEREEIVSSILWQMDTELTTLLAQEAARPHFVYSPSYTAPAVVLTENKDVAPPAKEPATKQAQATAPWPTQSFPSPLLTQPSSYVLLHFQIDARNRLTSPQVPLQQTDWAVEHGASLDNIDRSSERLEALKSDLAYDSLIRLIPTRPLPEIAVGQWQVKGELATAQTEPQIVGNSLSYPPVQEKLRTEGYGQQAPPPAPSQAANPEAYGEYLSSSSFRQQRAGNDLQERNRAYQSAAQRQVAEQRLSLRSTPPQLKYVSEGVSQPLWLGERLLLARRVKVGDDELVQGCWLDWAKIRSELLDSYSAGLPDIDLLPVRTETDRSKIKVSRLLATLPAQLVVPEMSFPPQGWSPLRIALVAAWSMLALAAVAVAILLQGVVTLSERRGAFVSAVTHELRTPLTTFRMYAEMLAANMVPDAQTRQQYLETLRVEADRLSHLVENVLAYAKLERGRHAQRREATTLRALVEHSEPRFCERAAQAQMEWVLEHNSASDVVVRTDPAAVEQILFNLVDNACKYASAAQDRRIVVSLCQQNGFAIVRVSDHGPGISEKAARRLFRPFSKSVHDAACSAPGVGLGLALSRRLAHELGGRLQFERTPGGATFALYLPL